jgi:hypothetical protein
MDRSNENTKDGKLQRFEIVSIILESPNLVDIFDEKDIARMRDYRRLGAYHVDIEVGLDMESA